MSSERLDYIRGFLDTLYTDDEFLNSFLDCIIDPQNNDGFKLLKNKGFEFQPGDYNLLGQLRVPNKHFEVRLAGGAYRFHTNENRFWELLVDSKAKAIYIDANLVENQTIDDEGHVCFAYAEYNFRLRFEVPWILGEERPNHFGFSGQITKADGASTQSILGHRIFPKGNAFSPDLPTNPDLPSSQTASEELMEKVDRFMRELTGKAYAVNIDLIETCRPNGGGSSSTSAANLSDAFLMLPSLPNGEELLTATNGVFSSAGLAFRATETSGKAWAAALGGVLGATGSLLTTSVKTRLVDDGQRRMTNDILIIKVRNVEDMLSEKGRELVNNVALSELRNRDFVDQVRKQFRDNYYIPWAKLNMNTYLRSAYWTMRKFWYNAWLNCYNKALAIRFDENMPKASMDALFKHFMEQRWATDVAPSRIKEISQEITDKEREHDEKIAAIDREKHLSEEDKEKKREDVRKEFKRQKEKLEEEQSKIDHETKDIDNRRKNEVTKKLLESIKHDAEEARQRELRRVRAEEKFH
ncbi:hypothetical protein UA08_07441 [Talaromyces atroroseus]|uniref:Uncharacterized protein n=1 Tax=Talaromyces atroroseus TaxID=1441469 RepID=A0A225AJ26_TALAT|nr:hypothetical protein UA08_07441 [Talaromyces atroroseus]OKL57158.1 hypothetical protein UA08_07441 [Talaromyces atroroseus]